MSAPVDRRRLLQLIEHFQPAGYAWRGVALRTRDAWVRALASATEAEVAPWARELERRATLGTPALSQRAEIVDVPPGERDA